MIDDEQISDNKCQNLCTSIINCSIIERAKMINLTAELYCVSSVA